MTPSTKKQTAFRIDPEILEGLRQVKERDGVPVSEQVRRALTAWLADRGVIKADRKRAVTRKRS
ncbi:MAG: ribbon-helix-helix domain-containing protein [Vicinamibacterales bacterium]|nr:ribbon-helix-helix domain-containing protein [Vicinamibacterales bacterium]